MPHAVASSDGLAPVQHYEDVLRQCLDIAYEIKADRDIEPAFKAADLGGEAGIMSRLGGDEVASGKEEQAASIETALRRMFYQVLATTRIEDPQFVKIWTLLDITTMLSDIGSCDYNLPFLLVEELLESQTLDGCRKVFDYLESRRDAMVARQYNKKYLTILRTCNDLLKRLSRAEDTVFCGRVFIYLFSTLTFGDRSSVNLRGEFHLANVTTFDQDSTKKTDDATNMEVDPPEAQAANVSGDSKATITLTEPGQGKDAKTVSLDSKSTNAGTKTKDALEALDFDSLYPIFWSLQGYFAKPTSLFEPQNLNSFKSGLEATLLKFKQVQKDTDTVNAANEDKPSSKRKWQGEEETSKAAFNPKYLTSRDLFELEISDVAFRRHVLVQGLILIDFLLSQTPKAKLKLENSKNKAVIWSFILEEEQAVWAEKMRNEIATYLQQGVEGRFYFRMVETVLSRDKNWVYWKAEGCPLFSRDPVPPEQYAEARVGAKRATAIRRPKNNPLGALDLGFLSDSQTNNALERLRDPARFGVPSMSSYRTSIENDTDKLETAEGDAKERVFESRASKTWKTLRLASRSRFSAFDKLDDSNNLDKLFEEPDDDENTAQGEDTEEQDLPKEEQSESHNKAEETDGMDGTTDLRDEKTEVPEKGEAKHPNGSGSGASSEQARSVEVTKGDTVPHMASAGDTQVQDQEGANATVVEDSAIT